MSNQDREPTLGEEDDAPVVRSPDTMTVQSTPVQPVLYTADGVALVRQCRIGFRS